MVVEHDVAIVGSGVSGMTCARYLRNANVDCVVFGDYTMSSLASATGVSNFPGFGKADGLDIVEQMSKDLFKPTDILDDVEKIDLYDNGETFFITAGDHRVNSKVVVVATGTKPKNAGLEGEDALIGDGISYCAYCDGSLCGGKDVVVIGGGNNAFQSAIYLSMLAKTVTVILRRNVFRADKSLVERANRIGNIRMLFNVQLNRVRMEDGRIHLNDGNFFDISCDHVFYAVGRIPNTDVVKNLHPEIDDGGYLKVKNHMTSIRNLYACGDVCDSSRFKQAVIAAGDGAETALEIIGGLK